MAGRSHFGNEYSVEYVGDRDKGGLEVYCRVHIVPELCNFLAP